EATADGNVVLDGGANDEHLKASHAKYNLRTESGTFDDVTGTIGVDTHGSHFVLTSSNPFFFTGRVVEKTGPNHYVVHKGTVTTCELPRPKWQFHAQKVTVDVTGDAKIYHSTFNIEGVPIFYFPFASQPVQRERQSGILIPNIGNSSRKGTVLGEAFYWAINRTMDLTAGTEYFSKRGWAPQGEFRVRPDEKSYADLTFFSVFDRGILQQVAQTPTPGNPNPPPIVEKVDQGGTNVRLNAESIFLYNFRAVADVDYLSSYVFRLAFNEIFSQAVNSEVKSVAFLSNTTNGFSSNALTEHYQNFESTSPGDVVTIVHLPSFEGSSVERRIGRSPFYWSYDAAAEGMFRSEPGFRTAPLVGRFDVYPRLTMPLQLRGWSVEPEIRVRDTFYTQQLQPSSSPGGVGVADSDLINRKMLEGLVEIRPPALERTFGKPFWGRKWKHVIEPRVAYRYVTGVDNFDRILRFDARDILSNTNEVEYGLINRIYSKRTTDGPEDCGPAGMSTLNIGGRPHSSRIPWEQDGDGNDDCSQPTVREVVSWELAQKYFLDPTFGGALVPGVRNMFTTTADLTGIAFLTDARRLSPLISRLRIQTTARSDAEWDLDYDIKKGRINASTALVNYRIGPFTLGGGDSFLRLAGESLAPSSANAPQFFNQLRVVLGYGRPNKPGFSAATNIGFDATQSFLQYGAAQTTYNWDCCGVTIEYRNFNLGQVRHENQFRFTFSLANVGAFGNLGRKQRLF
ncbi:MAG TPA: LPS assembly protein LptD, partial [Terriglobales bacterium]